MGHSHSGFASTKLKSSKSPQRPQNKLIDVTKKSTTSLKPSAPFSPSLDNNIIPTAPSAPYSPSDQSNYSNNSNAATPLYQQQGYQQYPEEVSPYHAVVTDQEQKKQQSEINPYINGYVNPYYANLHQNVDIKKCTTPKTKRLYRPRTASNVTSFAELAQAKIPKQNQIEQISTIYKYIKQLGTGASSRVLLVENIKTGEKYAMKELLRNNEANHHLLLREIKILNMLKCADDQVKNNGIVQIYDIYMDNVSYYILMEYCDGGNLLYKVLELHHFSEQQGAKYMKSILQSVDIIHKKNICHRDLKPNNIVFNRGNQLKIIDFGQSEIIENNEKIYAFKQVGTTSFVPPEFHRSRSGLELKKGDSWSIGCICFLLMCGKTLFGGNNSKDIWNKIIGFNDKFLQDSYPKNIHLSNECKDFISKLLNKNVHKRLSIKQALQHEWITNIHHVSDKPLGSPVMAGLTEIVTTNKLQKILADAILSEMDENEIKILMENIKDKDDVIEQLIKYHHSNYHAINLNDKDTENHEQLMHHRAHYVMRTVTLFMGSEIKLDDDQHFEDDEEFKSMEYIPQEEYNSDAMSPNGIDNGEFFEQQQHGNQNNDGSKSVSVMEFRAIMKQSKKEYNIDKLIKDLDPNNTGYIAFHAIAHFMKPVKTHRVLPGY